MKCSIAEKERVNGVTECVATSPKSSLVSQTDPPDINHTFTAKTRCTKPIFKEASILDSGHIFIEEFQERYRKERGKRGEGEKKKHEAENVARTQHHA
jgi:hypothetical protein